MFVMRATRCVPHPPSGRSGRTKHRSRNSRAGLNGSAFVGICHHCKVFSHVETGYENEPQFFSVPLLTGKLSPRLVVAFSVFFECEVQLGIFVVCWVPCRQGRGTIPGELQ